MAHNANIGLCCGTKLNKRLLDDHMLLKAEMLWNVACM